MRFSGSLTAALATLAVVALAASAAAAPRDKDSQKPMRVTGTVTSVDHDARTLAIKTKKGEETVRFRPKAYVYLREKGAKSDLEDGMFLDVYGKMDKANGVLEVRHAIVPMNYKVKPRLSGGKATGPLSIDGDTMTVDTRKQKFELRWTKSSNISLATRYKPTDIREGLRVTANYRPFEMKDGAIVARGFHLHTKP